MKEGDRSASGAAPWNALRARLGVLDEHDFGLYFVALTTSNFGTAMVPVALSFAVLGNGGSVSDVGYVLGAGTAPLVLFLLVGGVVADRYGRRRVMISSDLLRAIAQGALAIVLLVSHPSLTEFIVLGLVVGLGTAFFSPAMSGLVTDVTARQNFTQANAYRGIASSAGRLFGPIMGGVLVATAGAGVAIAIDSATYLISAWCLIAITARPALHAVHEPFLAELRAGWTDFRSRTWLWLGVAQFALFLPLVNAPFLVLGAVIAERQFGGAGAWGVVLGAQGVGAIVAGILVMRVRISRSLVVAEIGIACWALPLLALAWREPLLVLVATVAVAGMGFGAYVTLWTTTMQREIPPHLMSRVSAYDWFGSMVFSSVGFVVAGPIGSAIGFRDSFIAGAAFLLLSGIGILLVRSVREIGDPRGGQPAEPLGGSGLAAGLQAR